MPHVCSLFSLRFLFLIEENRHTHFWRRQIWYIALLPVLRLSPHYWGRMILLYWHLGPRRRRANIVTWAEAAWARTARLLTANNLREASQWAVQGQCFGSCFSFDNTWATWPDTWLATVCIKGHKYLINWLLTCQEPHVHSHVTSLALCIGISTAYCI